MRRHCATRARSACGRNRATPHSVGYLKQHVPLRPHCVLHYPGNSRHTPRGANYRHQYGGAGGTQALSPGRRLRVYSLRFRDSRRRPDRRAGIRRLRRLCCPKPWVESRAGTQGHRRSGLYGIIAVSVLAGLAIQYLPISPMKALFWSAVIKGIVALLLMVVIILLVSKKSVMGDFTASQPFIIFGWIATAVMGAAAV